MSDLISKGKLFNSLANAHDKAEIFAIIQNMETVDAVEVVRCKDCKHWEAIETLIGVDCVCTAQGDMNVSKDENDYCSWGERKEE